MTFKLPGTGYGWLLTPAPEAQERCRWLAVLKSSGDDNHYHIHLQQKIAANQEP
jgi:hypothetical protein